MYSDPFDVLGLDRSTATDADVRRAYATKLKITRPEDDRAGFMALRAAFERARDEVRWRAQYGDETDDEDESDAATSKIAAFPVGAVAIGDVPLAEIAERSQDALPGTADGVIDYNAEMAAAGTFEPLTADFAHAGEDAYSEEPPDPFELSIDAAMDRLIDMLTLEPSGARGKDVMAVLDHPDVSGIEEYQAMQWRVRQLLCDRTGYFAEPKDMRRPGWLTLDVFDTLDTYYGWTRQPTTHGYVRGMNDWLVRLRREISLDGQPPGARRAAALQDVKAELFDDDTPPQERGRSGGGGGNVWLWIGAGILISQVVRFIGTASGG